MNEPIWVIEAVVESVHSILLSAHGGGMGVRDRGLLQSALSRVKQEFTYHPETSIVNLAAAYSFGIAKNHPFVDGNKRTAFTVGALFLELNGFTLDASEVDAAIQFNRLASGEISEEDLARWFETHCAKL